MATHRVSISIQQPNTVGDPALIRAFYFASEEEATQVFNQLVNKLRTAPITLWDTTVRLSKAEALGGAVLFVWFKEETVPAHNV